MRQIHNRKLDYENEYRLEYLSVVHISRFCSKSIHTNSSKVSFSTLYYAYFVRFMVSTPVWQMVREAVNSLGGTASRRQIINYIELHHGSSVHKGTISCQIALCTVNSPSRVHFPQNKKARKANGGYDFLFSIRKGVVTLYKPEIHGNWEIIIRNGKPEIASDGESIEKYPERISVKKYPAYAKIKTKLQAAIHRDHSPVKKYPAYAEKKNDYSTSPYPENWLDMYPDTATIPSAVWNEFASKLEERFDKNISTTEDSVRYLFFYALTQHGFDPNQIIQEYRYKSTEIDTVINLDTSRIAYEFKFHKEQLNTGIPMPMNAGQLFSDFFRLKRFMDVNKDTSCFSVYVMGDSMRKYFANREGKLREWYLANGEVLVGHDDFANMPETFLKYAGEITWCRTKTMRKNIGKKYHLIVTEIL